MSFFNTLFKMIKTTANVTSAGLEHLNKGLDSINQSLDEAVKLQEIMSEAKVAYNITIKLINISDEHLEEALNNSSIFAIIVVSSIF